MTVAIDELLVSTSQVEIQANGKPPTVTIVAYTGGLMTVPGWGPVAIDLAGVDISAAQVSILADHNSTLSGIVGHGRAAVDGRKLVVAGTITPTTEAARHIADQHRAVLIEAKNESDLFARIMSGELPNHTANWRDPLPPNPDYSVLDEPLVEP